LDSQANYLRLLCTWSVAAFVFVTLTDLSASGPHTGPQIRDKYIYAEHAEDSGIICALIK
jgi:hypothetical protein